MPMALTKPVFLAGLFLSAIAGIAWLAMDTVSDPTISFSDLDGWADDDHGKALAVFQRSCAWLFRRADAGDTKALETPYLAVCREAINLPVDAPHQAREFFERRFEPYRPGADDDPSNGFVTGYYEPEVDGSLVKTEVFSAPLYRRPADLIKIDDTNRPADLSDDIQFARQNPDSSIVAHPDRAAIEAGALSGQGLELVWLRDPVDAFFIHVQGSARIRLSDGTAMRVGFDGKSGHPYTAIGKVLVNQGELTLEQANMQGLRKWLAANPDQRDEVLQQNRSFIFFRRRDADHPDDGPIGAGGVPLTAGRSLAIDRTLYPLLMPVWISGLFPADNGGTEPFRRLMIGQDTGSAIVGPARGDIFYGSGREAGQYAGNIRHKVDFVVLRPIEADHGR